MKVIEKFLPDAGARLSLGGKSIVQFANGIGEAMSDQQIFEFARSLTTYYRAIGHDVAVPTKFGPPLTESLFIDRAGEPMRKYVSAETWERHMSKGYFQLPNASFYRATSNAKIKDGNEGLTFAVFVWNLRAWHMLLESGANYGLFCGTGHAAGSTPVELVERFADVSLVIPDTRAFAERVQKRVGAKSFLVRDIVYSDAQTFRQLADFSEMESALEAYPFIGSMPVELRPRLNRITFDLVYKFGIYPSIFSKPATRYSIEQERRIAFEMPSDLANGVIRFRDEGLLDLIRPE
jgi:hypothetical protein